MQWKQKALAIKHYEATEPKMKFRELAQLCKTTFKLKLHGEKRMDEQTTTTRTEAWPLLENSSTHVAWEGVIVKTWNVNNLSAKGFES